MPDEQNYIQVLDDYVKAIIVLLEGKPEYEWNRIIDDYFYYLPAYLKERVVKKLADRGYMVFASSDFGNIEKYNKGRHTDKTPVEQRDYRWRREYPSEGSNMAEGEYYKIPLKKALSIASEVFAAYGMKYPGDIEITDMFRWADFRKKSNLSIIELYEQYKASEERNFKDDDYEVRIANYHAMTQSVICKIEPGYHPRCYVCPIFLALGNNDIEKLKDLRKYYSCPIPEEELTAINYKIP